jgi:hypothetical protein
MLVVKKFPLGIFLQRKLQFGSHSFKQHFLQAKVSEPFLGIDFLSKNSLMIATN